ncbi:MAG: DUF4199 domain-containing protein [Flavobacteriales bacterium]
MSRAVTTGLFFAALFAIIKCLLFLTEKHEPWYSFIPLLNIGLVMLACGIGMWYTRDTKGNFPTSTLDRIRAGMRSGMVYALFTALFVFVYYKSIDPMFTYNRIKERVAVAEKLEFSKIQKDNPEKYGNKSRNDFIQDEREQAELWYSPFMNATLTLTGLMVCSLFYSIILSFFFKLLHSKRSLKPR